ncbi:L,D-transpeptidase family protein [Hyphomicrobium facile]|uniref:Lipoprotein-anchoring transpeptidase ErfK/SrfK n=1 Tax=Hyphomicrobium facile TaxID=51670 RepID=A0A1I7NJG4_9HYPH|nr:L,D-transpeptidase family protein [Hyphomicrobium facile]SFV34749.1 Lipoprotein-anchoring transpeptidase ErfK/SrfK [Hyphomicrobium facile]
MFVGPSAVDAKSKAGILKSARDAAIITPPTSPLLVVVSIRRQKVRVYDANGEIASSRISSGRPGFETPTGVFSILEKNVYHTSNIYSGASMPYQERITWSGIAFHAGDIPGFPASHGCIRLPFAFAKKLYGLTKLGTRVVVTSEEVEPIAFDSPKLFQPLPADEASAMKSDRSKPAQLAVNDQPDDSSTSDALQELPLFIGVSPALIRAVADMPRDPQRRPTTRAEADQIMQEKLDRARASLKTAEAALATAQERATATAKEFEGPSQRYEMARRAVEPLRENLKAAEARQQDAMKAFAAYMSGATTTTTLQLASADANVSLDRESALEEALLDLTIEADRARAQAAQGEMSFAEVQAGYSAAQTARDTAADVLRDAQSDLTSAQAALSDANKEMRLRSKPVSVLVSLRAKRLYIRQGIDPLLEAPITVAPLPHRVGTHVFTAMRYSTDPNTFDWRLVSAQTPVAGQPFEDGKKKRSRTALALGRALNVQMATEALSAFTIPDDILATITELARPGSSLIVSDGELPLHENGNGTEFVVMTR